MEEFELENLQEPVSRYTLTANSLNDFLDKLKNLVTTNANLILDATKEDIKKSKFNNRKQVKVEELSNIIENYREDECILNDDERKILIYRGDPYVTLHICLQAITQRTKVILMEENYMLEVNQVLLSLLNELLQEYNITNLISRIDNFQVQDFQKIKNYFDETIVIGDTTTYQILEKYDKKIKFYPYNNIAIYCDSKELEPLQEAIYAYANENQYEIEIVYANHFEEAINIINADDSKSTAVLLSKDEVKCDRFLEKNVKNKCKTNGCCVAQQPLSVNSILFVFGFFIGFFFGFGQTNCKNAFNSPLVNLFYRKGKACTFNYRVFVLFRNTSKL